MEQSMEHKMEHAMERAERIGVSRTLGLNGCGLTAASTLEASQHLEQILGVAIVNNPRLGIGGALFLNPRTLQVVQTLEGVEAHVRPLYEKIAKDRRHTDCKILSEVRAKERTYEQWGMLQGDLQDWSALAVGQASASVTPALKRRRRAREDMEAEGAVLTRTS